MSTEAKTEDKSSKSDDLENRYKDTIDLPQTTFPMRGNGPVREPEFQKTWEETKVYEKNLGARKAQGAKPFILHDGPPYLSSDKIHIGTALNKILKDIIIKYKSQQGFISPYIPGYDSHGLPIENAVVKKIKGGRAAVSVAELREKCKEFALKNLNGQEAKFKRLGVWGDWEHPYITLQEKFEAEQLRLFAEMAAKGHIYRGLKTVYWSYGCETALADAEVEYNDEHVSNSIYVAFKVKPESIEQNEILNNFKYKNILKDSKVLIWTTTPWTIPGNLAISLHKDFEYVIVEACKESKPDQSLGKLVLAKELVASLAKSASLEIKELTEPFKGSELEGLVTQHPLFDRESPIIFGDHVTTEAGTGCVHTAPGHGQEDFIIGKEYGLDILCPVNGKGVYTAEAGIYKAALDQIPEGLQNSEFLAPLIEEIKENGGVKFEGIHVIKDGNDKMIKALILSGSLIHKNKITHSYPYCWRSKTPLLYRATEQWFASVDGFREQALKEIDKVKWIPERGHNRIYAMVEDRGDWCISRQRTWGVPIPALYDKSKVNESGNYESILDPEIIEEVAKVFEQEGSSAWYQKEIQDLVPQSLLESKGLKAENLVKETDTMDVWFDSGSTHRSVVAARAEEFFMKAGEFTPVDLYLEGSDQHRGWFQSSLLTSVATNGTAPYQSVLTHGFVVDEQGRKMSKSVGNVVDPEDVIKKYGADILRLWVASVDYSLDIKVGQNMFKQLTDIYRNFRNTSRYMLGNLFDFDPEQDSVAYDELWELDKLILHRLQKLTQELTTDFDNYQFFKYYQMIQNFCAVDLSAFYFDILKDRLYTHGTKSKSRRAAQTVLLELLSAINRLFVPVLPHLAEDIYSNAPEKIKTKFRNCSEFGNLDSACDSILLSNWPKVQAKYLDDELAAKWDKVLQIRDISNKEIEILRQEKKEIGKSLEAQIKIQAPKSTVELLKALEQEIKAVFIVSAVEFEELAEDSTDIGKVKITASKFDGVKCVRCWKYFKKEEIKEGICPQCTSAVNS